ncbi:MAG: thioredoxin domain-containing protein [Thermomicrobiales bacterium]|nr:thioredoxin domain-containing protein [Thermomicrobiales bacterium]
MSSERELRVPNLLANETSPYLQQHKNNPVDWRPWGAEALALARAEDRPILVSIGYSTCHWCHVMERESFENPDTAALMNDLFVNIKVDREERPDLDAIYMTAVQAITGQGGWPLNVFLTPDGVPFYGGTYFPPVDRQGMPSWTKVLEAAADAYRNRRDEVEESAANIRAYLAAANEETPTPSPLRAEILDAALTGMHQRFDDENGGFGSAPKFPQASVLQALLHIWKRTGDARASTMVRETLDHMARGGIYDQIGGGFHRYTVDAAWLVPHFEKMLYDNAQLARVYLDAYRAFGDPDYARVAEQTLEYVLRDMTGPEGQFYAAEDADSEGVEGKFYVWTPEEIETVLGSDVARVAMANYGVEPGGNFEGKSILHVPESADRVAARLGISPEQLAETIAAARPKLLAARAQRVRPGRDDKALAAWNGMMLRAFAEGGRVLNRPDFLSAAVRNSEFLTTQMRPDGRLMRSFTNGQAKIGGFLEDYANVADGLLATQAAVLETRWLREALDLTDEMVLEFADPSGVGFFDTAVSVEPLVARPRELQDGALPSGNAVATDVLLRAGAMTGDDRLTERAAAVLETLARPMAEQPLGFGRWLADLEFYLSPPTEVALAGDRSNPVMAAFQGVIYGGYHPNLVVGYADAGDVALGERVPFLAGRPTPDGAPRAYVCERFACLAPTADAEGLREQIERGTGLIWQEI